MIVFGKGKITQICNPLKQYDKQLYEMCVKNGYGIARDSLDAFMDDMGYAINDDPDYVASTFGFPSSDYVTRCVDGNELDFSEEDVYRVMEDMVHYTINDIKNNGLPKECYKKYELLIENSMNDAVADITTEKLHDVAKSKCKS